MQLPFGKKEAQSKDEADDKKKHGKDAGEKAGKSVRNGHVSGAKSKDASGKAEGKRKHVVKKEKPTEPTGIFGAPAQIMGPRLAFIAAVVILCLLGLVMIYSSSSIEAYGDSTFGNNPFYFFKQQVVWLAVGTVACVAAAAIPYSFWRNPRVAYALWAATAVLLFAVFIGLGTTSLGADRSLRLGPISIQPAEFAKISVILVMASTMERWHCGEIRANRAILEMGCIAFSTLFLIYEQPDLGTAMILIVGILALLTLAGIDKRFILGLIGLAAFYFIAVCIVQPYHIDRIMTMLDPWKDAQGNGYQSVQGFLAFGSGGIFGTGLGMSRQKYDYLPYAYNDFIFAVIGEELGLIGALATLLLFAVLIYAGVRIAHTAKDTFGAVVAGSLTCMIGFQACVNMACVVGMAPVTGKALPFISYGGSSLLATMIMCGLILSVSIRSRLDNQVEKRRENLVVMDGGKAPVRQGAAAAPNTGGVAGALGGIFGGVAGAVGGAASAVTEHLPGASSGNAAGSERGRHRNNTQAGQERSSSARNVSGSRRSSRIEETAAGSGHGGRADNRGDSRRTGYSSSSCQAGVQSAAYGGSSRSTGRSAGTQRAAYGSRSAGSGAAAAGGYGTAARQRSENVDAGHGYRHATGGRTTRAGYGSASNMSGSSSSSRSTQREQQSQALRRSRSRKGDMDLELVDIRPREGRRSSQRGNGSAEALGAGAQRSSRNGGRGGSGRPRSSSASHGGTSRRR